MPATNNPTDLQAAQSTAPCAPQGECKCGPNCQCGDDCGCKTAGDCTSDQA